MVAPSTSTKRANVTAGQHPTGPPAGALDHAMNPGTPRPLKGTDRATVVVAAAAVGSIRCHRR